MAYLQSMKKRWPILAGMAVFIVAGACMNAFGGLFIPRWRLFCACWVSGCRAGAGRNCGRKAVRPFADGLVRVRHAGVCGVQCAGQRQRRLLVAVAFGCCGAFGAVGKSAGRCLQPCVPDKPGDSWLCAAVLCLLALYCGRLASLCPARGGRRCRGASAGFFWNVGNAQSFPLGFPRRTFAFRLHPDVSLSFRAVSSRPFHGHRCFVL